MSRKETVKLTTAIEQLTATMTRINRFLTEHENEPISNIFTEQLETRKEILKSNFKTFQSYQLQLLTLNSNQEDMSEAFEQCYFDTLCKINIKLSANNVPNNNNSLQNNSPSHLSILSSPVSNTKLPNIEIPVFDGKNLNEFKPFIEIFNAVIDKNVALSDVEKLFYLRSYLRGEALTLVNTLPIVNSSYAEALNILQNRYNNEAMLINSHINSLLEIQSIQKGTPRELREFISKVKQQCSSLKNLNQPIDQWDMILICIFSKKLDTYTNRAFQMDRNTSKLPTLHEFLNFLENRATALETAGSSEKPQVKNVHYLTEKESQCSHCNFKGHKIFSCRKFKSLSTNDRISFVDRNKLCRLCLKNHSGKCKMSFRCGTCQKDHNTLLHLDRQPQSDTKVMHFNFAQEQHESVLLPTIRVKIKTNNGKYIFARGLVDTGSQVSLVKNSLVKRLNVKTFDNILNIIGISENSTKINKSVNILIESLVHNFSKYVKFAVVEKITSNLPNINFDISSFIVPKNVQLSDDSFSQSGQIDFLLGANIAFEIFLPEKFVDNMIYFQNTLFGYVVSGSVPSHIACSFVALHATYSDLEKTISQFWETEKVPEIFSEYSNEQEACESSFRDSLEVNNCKFQVKLPLKQTEIDLGDSFSVAIKRLENLERRFRANPDLFVSYKNFIQDYLDLGHAKIVYYNSEELKNGSVYFMAHHPVIREEKKTTKLRVVFDGSMKSKSKKCINDFLHNGAVVQNELFDVLLLFRTYKFVLSTDIKQMYRMVLIHPDHRRLQNILWKDSDGSLQFIQLQTVTYGLKSSSFLATRCLLELSQTEGKKFPLAANALMNNTYVDDILSGADTVDEAIRLKDELISLLDLRSFSLHKWCTNEPHILTDIPMEKQNFDEIDINKNNFVTKTLGMSYNTVTDNFKLSTPKIFDINECVTKRQVLSLISKFYDPLGLSGPVLVAAKVIMQKIWMSKINWDQVLPDELLEAWKNFIQGFIDMPTLEIPRNLHFTDAINIELIGFCDASLIAYGAVMYTRTIFHDRIHVNLTCSKSRIAPLSKKLTIPRLELNGALLLASLAEKLFNLLESKVNAVYLYSDSSIVLAWLKSNPLQLNPYVANRVIKIKNSTSNFKWLYINTKENPADCLSRGLEPQDISSKKMWFHGPDILSDMAFRHHETFTEIPSSLPEQKIIHFVKTKPVLFFKDFSSISKLQRVIAYMFRFVYNSRKNSTEKLQGNLKLSELDNAFKTIIKCEQNLYFFDDIKCLISDHSLKSSSLYSLAPFIDGEGILRVGGRLQHSNLPFNQKHPVILPKGSHVTNLIIHRTHLNLLHAGPRQVLSSLNLNYWVSNGIREVKKIIHKCVTCFKYKARCSSQLMGSLPEKRVSSSRVFKNVGVDFCGPFQIKQSRIRKSVTSKAYIALFVCFSVKAIHMELLSDMTTENFLAAFKRFISRRGKPTNVFCDNGSTFKGAQNKINEFYQEGQKIDNYCLDEKIQFNFIPSYSPVFGGLWEAGVKSAKFHIKRVMGGTELTYEQFNTLIIQVEGILNSRPLVALSQDPSDLDYLTPGHFLIGAAITSFPEPDLSEIPSNRLKFWRLCVQMQQHFWSKWHCDYLTQLQNRPKWREASPNLREGMLVILKEDNVPSFKWPMARITKTVPGKDGKVRVVEVKTQKGVYLRSVTKVAILPIDDNF